MAMVDMSDNANKFGTNMQDIQNAYQGFAKQNYTMLDNLKLGYGGTKTEMERLLKDAQAFSGVEYNIDSLADVYEAIHVIQEEMGVAGTTAIEASETFSGSFSAMKAAFQNTLGSLALGENIGPALQGLAETVSTFLFGNFIPMVLNIVKSIVPALTELVISGAPQLIESGMNLLTSLSEGFVTGIPTLLESVSSIVTGISDWLVNSFPSILQRGVELIVNLASGIMSSAPAVFDTIGNILTTVLTAVFDMIPSILKSGYDLIAGLAKGLLDNLPAVGESINKILQRLFALIIEKGPDILRSGVELIGKLASGLWNNLPTIISTISNILMNLIKTIATNFPKILDKGFELLGELAKGIVKGIPGVIAKVPEIFNSLKTAFNGILGGMLEIGRNIIMSLANGIGNAAGAVVAKAKQVAANILGSVKSFFGIASPSKVFKEIGGFLDAGLAEGISGNAGVVSKAMDDITKMTTGTLESDLNLSTAIPKAMQDLTADIDVNANKQSAQLTFVLGGQRFKAFVDDITKLQDRDTELELAY